VRVIETAANGLVVATFAERPDLSAKVFEHTQRQT
jgi:hypothetical protein